MYLNLKWEIFNYLFKFRKIKVPVKFAVNYIFKTTKYIVDINYTARKSYRYVFKYLYACRIGNDKQQTTINIII